MLGGWGYARARRIDGLGRSAAAAAGSVPVLRVTHVLLPVTVLLRRAYAAERIWAALTARADGSGHRRIGASLGVPAATVRAWLRRAAQRLEAVRVWFLRVAVDDSERRSLILVNPGLAPKRATVSTMYTAYRLNDANEIMPPHRHSPSAIRFGLKGKGNFTGVDGEDIVFGPGDMVLTPNDTWHNHGTVGNEQALNLSVLDLPLVETLNAIHFEHDYKEEVNGKLVSKKQQTPRFSPDYSQRIYGYGGLLPRFASKAKRGRGTVLTDVRLSLGDDARIA